MFTGLTFIAGGIALAGAAAALGPVIIHLLNRRRYRVVEWAAMDFLREALSRNRRVVEMRDLLLMLLRMACLALLGLALARPYWSHQSADQSGGGPLHAVLLIDNSLSMGYERLNGTLLDAAKSKAQAFVGRLPQGSRVSVLPLCAAEGEFSYDGYRNRDDALEAIRSIEIADRACNVVQALERAAAACRAVDDLSAKRLVLLGDQQALNWPVDAARGLSDSIPELQVVSIAPEEPQNAWVAELRLRDGVADIESDTVFLSTIRYEGAQPRNSVEVVLSIDGAPVSSRTIDLEPGQSREVTFTHRFDVAPEEGEVRFAAAEVSIPPDQLPQDDRLALAAPVVASLPVVFIDQYGAAENPDRNEYGETYRLRRLLAPVTARTDAGKQLIRIRQLTIEQVDEESLAEARLVVMAGVANPQPAVDVLRQYVAQGGQLLIAAGAGFDPGAWQQSAWRDGAGILPAPLDPEPVGELPSDSGGELRPFFLDPTSMVHDYFLLDQVDRQELDDLYRLPYFFRAVRPLLEPETLARLAEQEAARGAAEQTFLTELETKLTAWSEAETRGALTDAQRAEREVALAERDRIQPHWLRWQAVAPELSSSTDPGTTSALAAGPPSSASTQPRPLARYTNQIPFLLERSVGRGTVLFCTTGIHSEWNNLTKTNAVLLFDRVLRAALERTLPQRNLDSSQTLRLPLPPERRHDRFAVVRPDRPGEDPLTAEALGGDRYGLTVRNTSQRGIYRLLGWRAPVGESTPNAAASDAPWLDVPFAVTGPEEESLLTSLNASGWRERWGDAPGRWVEETDEISLEGARTIGRDWWKGILLALLVLLLLEIVALAFWVTAPLRPAAGKPKPSGSGRQGSSAQGSRGDAPRPSDGRNDSSATPPREVAV